MMIHEARLWSMKTFGSRLDERSHPSKHSRSGDFRLGLEVRM